MPLYEYRCRKCGRHLEKIQKFSDHPLKTCKTCGGQLERLLSAPTIQFKGSGWYVTDYARKSTSAKTTDSESKPAESKPANEDKKASEPAKPTDSKDKTESKDKDKTPASKK